MATTKDFTARMSELLAQSGGRRFMCVHCCRWVRAIAALTGRSLAWFFLEIQ